MYGVDCHDIILILLFAFIRIVSCCSCYSCLIAMKDIGAALCVVFALCNYALYWEYSEGIPPVGLDSQ